MKFILKSSKKAEKIVNSLSVRELIGQVVCQHIFPEKQTAPKEAGSVFFFAASKEIASERAREIKEKSKIPPFIVTDLECGPGNLIEGATKFPSMMACSQADSEELAYQMGKIAALEGRAAGYHWSLAPVADILGEINSPMVSTRGAGHTANQVDKIAAAYLKGMQDNGMIATIKHFPGDGYCQFDQHLTTPENPLSMEEWHRLSGHVFQALIDKGAMAVMPGHISLPAYDEVDPKNGVYPPATLSKKLMTDLLRGEMGFEGIIISDAVNMGGFAGFKNYYEACATYLECGGDCLLFSILSEDFYEQIEKQIHKGNLSVETLKDRAYRMLCLKDQMGLFDADMPIAAFDIHAHQKIADEIVNKSITLVRDRNKTLPFQIKKHTRVLHYIILNQHDKRMTDELFAEIKKYTDYAEQMEDLGPENIFEIVQKGGYDLIICSTGGGISYGTNVAQLHGPVARNMMSGWMHLGTPIVFISHRHPFFHKEYEAAADTVINTYGHAKSTAQALLMGITGKQPLNRKLVAHD